MFLDFLAIPILIVGIDADGSEKLHFTTPYELAAVSEQITGTGHIDQSWFYSSRHVFQHWAMEWQLLEKKEIQRKKYFTNPYQFDWDLDMLRFTYLNLQDAPPIEDTYRLPPLETIEEMIAFNNLLFDNLTFRRSISWPKDRQNFDSACLEIRDLLNLWHLIHAAKSNCLYISCRRECLRQLLKDIGPDDYYSGKWPPFTVFWRLQSIDK